MAEAFPIHHEDEAQPEQVKKKGRFTKAWRSVFREGVVTKESIDAPKTLSRGLFFERAAIEQNSNETARRAAKSIIETLPKQSTELTPESAYNVTPDIQQSAEKHEQNEANEKAYELSHEHKDMDKQSWTAMQQAAYDQSQANAAAIAAAAKLAEDTAAPAPKKSQPQMVTLSYQKTITVIFVCLAILFAFIIAILLIQSK